MLDVAYLTNLVGIPVMFVILSKINTVECCCVCWVLPISRNDTCSIKVRTDGCGMKMYLYFTSSHVSYHEMAPGVCANITSHITGLRLHENL